VQPRELREAQRQLAVGALARAEHQAVAGAVHGLDAHFVFLAPVQYEHAVVEHVVVAGHLEQLGREELRAHDLVVTEAVIQPAHVLDERVVDVHALGQVERSARCPLVELEQLELRAELAVVAGARLLEAFLVLAQILVAAPVRSREIGQLVRADLGRVLHVRAAAQVDEVAVAIQGDLRVGGQIPDPRDLELLTRIAEAAQRLFARDHFAFEGRTRVDDALHLLGDRGQVFGRESVRHVEVVLELLAVVGATDVDLGSGPQPLHGIGHHVFGRVSDHFGAFRIAAGDQTQRAAARQRRAQVEPLAVELRSKRGLRETGTDLRSDIERSTARGDTQAGSVRQLDFELHLGLVRAHRLGRELRTRMRVTLSGAAGRS